jgi:TP901 family phage tail tape measure protein
VTGAVGEDFRLLEETARQAGATTRFTATQAAEGLLELARAGLSVRDSATALAPSLNLATAGLMSLAESSDLVTNVAAQFGMPATQIQRIGDILVATANRSNTNVAQLGQALKDVGVVAANLGVSIEDTNAALGVLANRGLKGSDGAIKLRQAFLQLLSPSNEAQQVLREMGLGLQDVDIRSIGLTQALKNLRKANLDIVQAAGLVDSRNAAALVALTQSVDEFEGLSKAVQSSSGEMQKFADSMNNTIVGAWKAFNSALDEMLLKIGDSGVGAALRGFLDALTHVTRMLSGTTTPLLTEVNVLLDGTNLKLKVQEDAWYSVAKAAETAARASMGIPFGATPYDIRLQGTKTPTYSAPIGPLNKGAFAKANPGFNDLPSAEDLAKLSPVDRFRLLAQFGAMEQFRSPVGPRTYNTRNIYGPTGQLSDQVALPIGPRSGGLFAQGPLQYGMGEDQVGPSFEDVTAAVEQTTAAFNALPTALDQFKMDLAESVAGGVGDFLRSLKDNGDIGQALSDGLTSISDRMFENSVQSIENSLSAALGGALGVPVSASPGEQAIVTTLQQTNAILSSIDGKAGIAASGGGAGGTPGAAAGGAWSGLGSSLALGGIGLGLGLLGSRMSRSGGGGADDRGVGYEVRGGGVTINDYSRTSIQSSGNPRQTIRTARMAQEDRWNRFRGGR